jgi:hypothetical protein
MTTQPLELTVNPSAVKIPEGYGTYHGHTDIINDSHTTITVTPQLIRFQGAHACTAKPITWLTVGYQDKPLKLAGGHTLTLNYTVHATPGVTGTAAVVGMAAGPKTKAGVIGGAVGERVTVGDGKQTCAVVHASAPHAGSSLPWGVIGLAVGLALLLVLLVAFARRRRTHA